jgi:hypothetical protein
LKGHILLSRQKPNRTGQIHLMTTRLQTKDNEKINGKRKTLKLATWNVRGVNFKEDQLDDILQKKKLKLQLYQKLKRN